MQSQCLHFPRRCIWHCGSRSSFRSPHHSTVMMRGSMSTDSAFTQSSLGVLCITARLDSVCPYSSLQGKDYRQAPSIRWETEAVDEESLEECYILCEKQSSVWPPSGTEPRGLGVFSEGFNNFEKSRKIFRTFSVHFPSMGETLRTNYPLFLPKLVFPNPWSSHSHPRIPCIFSQAAKSNNQKPTPFPTNPPWFGLTWNSYWNKGARRRKSCRDCWMGDSRMHLKLTSRSVGQKLYSTKH